MKTEIPNGISLKKEVLSRINHIRIQNNLKQDQLAEELAISQSAVSKYLTQRIPPAVVLLKLARLGSTTIEWILTGEKKHFFHENYLVKEKEEPYGEDIDINLAKKIAMLPPQRKQVIIQLLDIISGKD